jgi:hypothetical protein
VIQRVVKAQRFLLLGAKSLRVCNVIESCVVEMLCVVTVLFCCLWNAQDIEIVLRYKINSFNTISNAVSIPNIVHVNVFTIFVVA